MNNVYGGVMKGRNSQGIVFFIHLESKEKVLAIPAGSQKIHLIQDELTKRDLKEAAELHKNGEMSIDVLNELKRAFDMQYATKKVEKVEDRHDKIKRYMDKQKIYIELLFAIHSYFMPSMKEILYSFYNGKEPEKHSVKYGY